MNIGFLRGWLLLTAALVIGVAVAAGPGCGLNEDILENCNHPVPGGNPCMGQDDPCCEVCPCPGVCVEEPCPDAGKDAGEEAMMDAEAGPICEGTCVPLPPDGWSSPVLVWQGAPSEAPPCPDEAPFVELEGFAGLVSPPASCGACSCAPPDGTCVLPTTVTAASSASCPSSPDATLTPFDPPAAWDGGCTTPAPITAGAQCNGAPCVQSVSAGALTLTGDSCAASTGTPPGPTPPLSWTTAFLACAGTVDLAACDDPTTQVCVSPGEPPPLYMRCVYAFGDQTCPVAYPQAQSPAWIGADDTRACTPCACGAPAGSYCTAELDIFSDSACSQPEGSLPLSSDPLPAAACLTIPAPPPPAPPPALGSEQIDEKGPLTYHPGTCTPSGGATGTAVPNGPVTLCCAP